MVSCLQAEEEAAEAPAKRSKAAAKRARKKASRQAVAAAISSGQTATSIASKADAGTVVTSCMQQGAITVRRYAATVHKCCRVTSSPSCGGWQPGCPTT